MQNNVALTISLAQRHGQKLNPITLLAVAQDEIVRHGHTIETTLRSTGYMLLERAFEHQVRAQLNGE